jgi:hypothetical protein
MFHFVSRNHVILQCQLPQCNTHLHCTCIYYQILLPVYNDLPWQQRLLPIYNLQLLTYLISGFPLFSRYEIPGFFQDIYIYIWEVMWYHCAIMNYNPANYPALLMFSSSSASGTYLCKIFTNYNFLIVLLTVFVLYLGIEWSKWTF